MSTTRGAPTGATGERKLGRCQGLRLYQDQEIWLNEVKERQLVAPHEFMRAAIDFYRPLFEANLHRSISIEMMAVMAQAVRLAGDPDRVIAHIESLIMKLGSGSITDFPAEVRREVRQHARKLKRERRVAGSR